MARGASQPERLNEEADELDRRAQELDERENMQDSRKFMTCEMNSMSQSGYGQIDAARSRRRRKPRDTDSKTR